MSYSSAKNINALNDMVMVFYKGTGLQYPKKMFPVSWELARKSNFQNDMTTAELLEQMDKMEQAICSAHTHTGASPVDLFKKAMPTEDPGTCAAVWFLNIVCLLQRKALKNDNENGYVFFNVQ